MTNRIFHKFQVSYNIVRQKIVTKCDKYYKVWQDVIIKCNRYCKVWQFLQNETQHLSPSWTGFKLMLKFFNAYAFQDFTYVKVYFISCSRVNKIK